MKAKSRNTFLSISGGLAGIALVAVILVAVNVTLSAIRMRADLTEENLYTLSDGTINLLKKMEQPVTLKLFFSSSAPSVPSRIKAYARQVEDLLWEYKAHVGSELTIEKHDPEPDSDAEDWAVRYGVAAQNVDVFGGAAMYFGLVAVSGDVEGVIPAFNPQQEQRLEYNITRLLYRVTHPEKARIGVISSLPIMGSQTPPMPGMPRPQQQEAWSAIQALRRDHELEDLGPDVAAIDPGLDALMVIHPKGLSDDTLYAIDQYVLGGGHAMVFVDPLSIADDSAPAGGMQLRPPQRASNLERLFEAWGVEFTAGKVVADLEAATNVRGQNNRVERSLVAISLSTNNISGSEVLTSQLDSMLLPYAGSLADRTSDDVDFTPLLYSSDHAGTVGAMMAQHGGSAIQKEYEDSPARLTLAARLSGTFGTAFPDGPPAADDEDADDGEAAAAAAAEPGLTNGVSAVIVVADVDLLFDPVCVENVNFFGRRTKRARNDNLSFFANAVEMMAGSQDLIAVRSRGRFSRPFTRVQELQAKAMREWKGREAELEEKLRETERQLQQMQTGKQDNQRFILSEEQQEAIANYRKEELRIRRELKEVRKNLRSEIERLGVTVKVINIALVPVLVSLMGITYGMIRRRRSA